MDLLQKKDGDSGWVSEIDEKIFVERCVNAGCVVVGRKTFKQYEGEIYPVRDTTTIVLTKRSFSTNEKVLIAKSPLEAVKLAAKKGFKKLLLAGGGKTSAAFLKEGLIHEIFLSVHPLALGEGIRLFEGLNKEIAMRLLDSKKLDEGIVQLHYALN